MGYNQVANGIVTFLVGEAAADYIRRVYRKILSYPSRIFLLVESRADHYCTKRIKVAREILFGTPCDENGSLEFNAMRLKTEYKAELENTLKTGFLNPELHWSLILWRRENDQDTQVHEGVHCMLGDLLEAAPNCGLDTASDRLLLTKAARGQKNRRGPGSLYSFFII